MKVIGWIVAAGVVLFLLNKFKAPFTGLTPQRGEFGTPGVV